MKDEFIACGLNATEYDVFVHLLGRGRRAAGHIAKALNLKRSTVYSALQGLEASTTISLMQLCFLPVFSKTEPAECR